MPRVYLDANATTPLDPRVREAMLPWIDCGNASSPHAEGRAARAAIDRAREQVAQLVGARPREIGFTSGATEANALALLGVIRAQRTERVFCSAVEHPSVLRTLEALRPDVDVVVGAVDAQGRLAGEVPDGTGLVSCMLANNETGVVQPVAAVAARARKIGAVMHTDAVQACGKMPVILPVLDLVESVASDTTSPLFMLTFLVRICTFSDPAGTTMRKSVAIQFTNNVITVALSNLLKDGLTAKDVSVPSLGTG